MYCNNDGKNAEKVFIVSSSSSKKESLYLILSFIVIIFIAFILLKIREKPLYIQKITNTQISSYKEFNSVELGIYSEILNALIDIEAIKEEEGGYPEVKELENDEIPPFVKDEIWENRGKIEWELLFHDDIPLYVGKSNNLDITGNFVIEIDKKNIENSKVYYSKKNINTSLIRNRFDEVKELMKQVVSYTGNEERRKYREE